MGEAVESENNIENISLIKKDPSLLYVSLVLVGIILIMGYFTLFFDDPASLFKSTTSPQTVNVNNIGQLLQQNSDMTEQELKKSLTEFLKRFYFDWGHGYFDPPSYFAVVTQTFYNYHNLTHQQLSHIYKLKKARKENLSVNWDITSLDFRRENAHVIATYWGRENYLDNDRGEKLLMDIKYEIAINDEGKIVSFRPLETKELSSVRVARRDTTNILAAQTIDFKVYDTGEVDNPPQFSGGESAWLSYIASNLRYPPAAEESKIHGQVLVGFIVKQDGSVSDVKARSGISNDCDQEAVRLVSSSPRWQPGSINNTPVNTRMVVSINFSQ